MRQRRILISPLNWGFGHAGRMIPLALGLRDRGHEVIFCADSNLTKMAAGELPGIELIEIPGVKMRYSHFLPPYINILLRLPLLALASVIEHNTLKKLVIKYKPDVIISDNRFGFYNKNIFSVYVTHMLRIPFPVPFQFLEAIGIMMHRRIIRKYDLCLVPDYPGEPCISGKLSHGMKIPDNVVYAGPLSRFAGKSSKEPVKLNDNYICLILSGPEPQGTGFMKKVIAATEGSKMLILSGNVNHHLSSFPERITFILNPDTQTMRRCILNSRMVICRSGYTGLMELISLGKGAVLVPTPGQTEQEYLCDYHGRINGFIPLRENKLKDFGLISNDPASYIVTEYPDSGPLLENVLDILSEKEKKS